MTQVEVSVDLKETRAKVLEGLLQAQRVSGASTTTPNNSRLLSEFQGRRYEEVHTQK